MTTDVERNEQMELNETVIADPDAIDLATQWGKADAERKRLNKKIKDLGINEIKDSLKAYLQDFGIADAKAPVRFRLGGSGLVVKITPPGPAREVEFTTEPKMRMSLSKEEE